MSFADWLTWCLSVLTSGVNWLKSAVLLGVPLLYVLLAIVVMGVVIRAIIFRA